MHYLRRAGSRLTAGRTFPGRREGSWTVCAHTCVGSGPDSPVMAFAWRRKSASPTSSTDFPVKTDFGFQNNKKKFIITEKRALRFAQKGPGHVKSDSEMEPEPRGNREEERSGEGPACLPRAVARPEGTKDQLTPGLS